MVLARHIGWLSDQDVVDRIGTVTISVNGTATQVSLIGTNGQEISLNNDILEF